MKTKFLFGALCLPVVFAACTSEDIVESNVVSSMPLDRAVVDLKLTAGEDSRMAMGTNGQFAWEEGDKLGSVLVDPVNLWEVEATKTLGNNRWDYKNGSFSTQGTTVEGAWMFYFPYDQSVSSSREGVKVTKSIQYQEYDADGSKMAANDFRVSPIYFVNAAEGGQSNIEVRLNSVYSYGAINATFEEDVIVDKVLIKSETGTFNDKLIIKPALIASTATLNYAKEKNADDEYVPVELDESYGYIWADDEAEDVDKVPSAQGAEYALQNWAGDKEYNEETVTPIVAADGDQIDYILIRCGEGVATTSKKFSTRVLLPAGAHAFEFNVYFYTNKGVYVYDVNPTVYNGANLLFKRGCNVELNNVNRVEEVVLGGAAALAPATMAISEIEDNPYIVENKDLVALINSVTTTKPLNDVKMLGTVTIDDAVAAALQANEKVTSLKVADIDVNCGTQNLNKLNVTGTLTLKEGANVTFNGSTLGGLVIEEGATATVAKDYGKSGVETTVNGTLNIANTVATLTSKIYSDGGTINVGTAVAEDEDIPTITTYFQDIKSGNLNINVIMKGASSYVANLGLAEGDALNVTVDADVIGTQKFTVNATAVITNNAKISIEENNGSITNNGELTLATNNGVVDNNAIANVTTNNMYINQLTADAELVCNENATEGVINATIAKAEATVATNNGEIIVVDNARVQSTGNITYSAAEGFTLAELANLDARINKVIFNGDFEYTYGDTAPTIKATIVTYEFKGDLKLTKDWTLPEHSTVSFTGAEANISGGKLSNVETLSFGVEEQTLGDVVLVEAVATDAYIAQGVIIEKLVNLNIVGGAEVWNNGLVNAVTAGQVYFNGAATPSAPAKAQGWKGYEIK